MIDYGVFSNKTFLITGSTGLVGKALIRFLLLLSNNQKLHIRIIAVGRNKEKFYTRMQGVKHINQVVFFEHDVNDPFMCNERVDYIVSMASATHPRQYALDPIGTEMTNINGTMNMLNIASQNKGCRFLLTSSGDIYGDNIYNDCFLSEKDCGYIDCNTLRAGYIEGKRASEALCNAYREAKNVDFVIARLCRVYGEDMQLDDSKAVSQFILKGIKKEDIVLKSKGDQVFSYLYVEDVVDALIYILIKGLSGEAYNVSDNNQVFSLMELATMISKITGSKIVYDVPDEIEKKGASSFKNVKLDGSKIRKLGWEAAHSPAKSLRNTINGLRKVLC